MGMRVWVRVYVYGYEGVNEGVRVWLGGWG